MAENLLALAVKPLDVATPLLQARRMQQMESETRQADFTNRQQEMGAEFRGLAPYANTPEFGAKWGEAMDRLAQRGILDPQRHAQIRNTPSPLLLQQGLAMTDTPEMNLRRSDRAAEDQSYRDFQEANRPGSGTPPPGGPQPAASMLPAPATSSDPSYSVPRSQVLAANGAAPLPPSVAPQPAQASPAAAPLVWGDGAVGEPGALPPPGQPTGAAPQAAGGQPSAADLPPEARRMLNIIANPRSSEATRAAAGKAMERLVPEQGTFGVVGESADGRKVYGFIKPRAGTVTEYSARGATTAPASGMTGDAYLQTLDPGRAAQIKAIAEGRMAPPGGFALKSPQIQELVRQVAQFEPGFDLNVWTQRNATTRDFASGKSAQNVTSLNTVIGHLGDLMEKAKALDNYSLPAVNYVTNATSNALGDKRIAGYRLASKAVADELAKVFRQVGMSDSEIKQWHSALSENLSPEQQRETIKTAVGLLDSRLHALGDQRNRGFSTRVEPRSLLNETAQAKLKKIEAWASGEQPQPGQGGGALEVGKVVSGFRFKGGNPNEQSSWEPER